MPRKLSDDDVARLRDLWATTERPVSDLAGEFGVSARHVRRLVKEEQRPRIETIAGLNSETVLHDGVVAATLAYIDSLPELAEDDRPLAAIAVALARKVDALGSSDTGAAAQALPAAAREFVSVLDRLQAGAPRDPDRLDQINQKRAARRLAMMNGAAAA